MKFILISMSFLSSLVCLADTNKCQKKAEFTAKTLFFINESNVDAGMKVKQKKNNWGRSTRMSYETYEIEFQDQGGYALGEPYIIDIFPYGHGDCKVVGFKTK